MKVQGLQGGLLAYWVAMAEGIVDEQMAYKTFFMTRATGCWAFDSDPCMAATMMQRHKISAGYFDDQLVQDSWIATVRLLDGQVLTMIGDTLVLAVMRCRVAQVFGLDVAEVKGAKNA